jgi:hypothetical protein
MAGPYYVTSFSRASQIVLARNPNYRGHRPARPERIDITVGAPPATSIARVIAGTEDYYAAPALSPDAMSPAEETRLRARYGAARRVTGQRFFASPRTIVQHLAFNTARAVRDPRLRRAVGFALDRNALVAQRRADGPSLPTDQYLPPGLPGFRDASTYPLGGDLERARRLAGRHRRHVTLITANDAPFPQRAQIVHRLSGLPAVRRRPRRRSASARRSCSERAHRLRRSRAARTPLVHYRRRAALTSASSMRKPQRQQHDKPAAVRPGQHSRSSSAPDAGSEPVRAP